MDSRLCDQITAVATVQDLSAALDRLRHEAAVGTRKARVSLDDLARRTRIPRSTVHVYVTGRSVPPVDQLRLLLTALKVPREEHQAWLQARQRVLDAGSRPVEPGSVPQQVPPRPLNFVGRAEELARLDDVLGPGREAGTRVVVSGAGGIGKTGLVAHWLATRETAQHDGVLWVDLNGFSDRPPVSPARALVRMLVSLGHPQRGLPGDADLLSGLFRSSVATSRLLVVLDNAHDSAQVEPLLPGGALCDVLITSRDELRPLVARFGAERLRVSPLREREALTLLGGLVSGEEATAALRLCGGHPLALQIVRDLHARGRGRGLVAPPDGDVLDLLECGAAGGVRRAFDWSYRHLSEREQQLFRDLSAIPGTRLPLALAAEVLERPAAELAREMDALGDRHLLDPGDGSDWGRHDLMTAYAVEQSVEVDGEDHGESLRLRVVQALHRVARAGLREPSMVVLPPTPGQPLGDSLEEAGSWMDSHEDLVGAVLDDLARRPVGLSGWALAECVLALRRDQGYDFALRPFTCLAEQAERAGEWTAAAALWVRIGHQVRCVGRPEDALAALRRGLLAAETVGDACLLATTLSAAGLVAVHLSPAEGGRELMQRLASLLPEVPEGALRMTVLNNLGVMHQHRGHLERAIDFYRQVADHPRATPGVPEVLAGLNAMVLDLRAGRPEAARERLPDVLRHADRLPGGLRGPLAVVRALISIAEGETGAARELLAEAETLAQETGDRYLEAMRLLACGTLAVEEEDGVDRAFERARAYAAAAGVSSAVLMGLLDHADHQLSHGLLDEASDLYSRAVRLVESHDIRGELAGAARAGLRTARAGSVQ